MNNALKEGFPPFENEKAVELAIESVCAKFGRIKSLRIFPANATGSQQHQCLCLLTLDPPEAQHVLRSALQVSTYGGAIKFVVDVNKKWKGPSM